MTIRRNDLAVFQFMLKLTKCKTGGTFMQVEKRISIRRDALAWYSEQAAKGITSWYPANKHALTFFSPLLFALREGFDMWFARVPLTEWEMDRKSDEAERWYEQEVAKRRLEAAAASNKHSHYLRIRFVLYSDLRLLL